MSFICSSMQQAIIYLFFLQTVIYCSASGGEDMCTDGTCEHFQVSSGQLPEQFDPPVTFAEVAPHEANKDTTLKEALVYDSNPEGPVLKEDQVHTQSSVDCSDTEGEESACQARNVEETLKDATSSEKTLSSSEYWNQETEAENKLSPEESQIQGEEGKSETTETLYVTDAASPELEVIGFDKVSTYKPENEAGSSKEEVQSQPVQALPRRRYFPLLYTIKSLLNSFLYDFGEEGSNGEGQFNASEIHSGNASTPEDRVSDGNITVNGTEPGKKTRFQCAVTNVTLNTTGEVRIVNSTELLEILNISKNQKTSRCVLVMFFAPWCPFCAQAAPHYNALARAFPQLDILAVDTSHFSYLNARFGTVAVPNLMLFNARSAVRFNHTSRVLEQFVQFISNNTGLEANSSVVVEETDFLGPLPSVAVQGRDWLLWLAWAFVSMCTSYGFVNSQYGQGLITRLKVLWQEHQHIE